MADVPELIDNAAEALLLAQVFGRLEAAVKDGRQELTDWVDLEPAEALRYFEAKRIISRPVFDRMAEGARLNAFTVAGLQQQYMLEHAHELCAEAIAVGTPQREITRQLKAAFESWGVDEQAPHHIETVYRTNVIGAYQTGRYEQLQVTVKSRPYWRYRTVGDARVRPAHREMDGKVYRADSPIWDSWYPPNGYNCRCAIETLSQGELEDEGLAPELKAPKVKPDPGWAASPKTAARADKAVQQFRQAISRMPVLQPPKRATRGSKAFVSVGGLGQRSRAAVDRLAGLTPARADETARRLGSFSVAELPRLSGRQVMAHVPLPSMHADSLEQLVERLAADPNLGHLVRGMRLAARASYAPAVAGAPASATAIVANGISATTELELQITARSAADIQGLAELILQAESGHDGAIRRAPAVADLMLRGKHLPDLEGYAHAKLVREQVAGRTTIRLTGQNGAGSGEQVKVTRAKADALAAADAAPRR